MPQPSDPFESSEDKARIAGLSDGIFAIALTLLVLELRVPELANGLSLAQARSAFDQELLRLIPRLIFFALTFYVGSLTWLSHHRIFRHLERYDRRVLGLNLLFLAFISLLPFSTGLLSHGDLPEAWWIYCFNIVALEILLAVLFGYALRKGFLEAQIPIQEHRRYQVRMLVTPVVFALSAAIALLNLNLAYFVPLLLLPGFWWVGRSSPQN
ncbi:MAG: DUF1211 domain-containing protein [Thermaceae bacterium]|nr:DUF1211 domain-containing protein [Thermaceae bacterium]